MSKKKKYISSYVMPGANQGFWCSKKCEEENLKVVGIFPDGAVLFERLDWVDTEDPKYTICDDCSPIDDPLCDNCLGS